MKTFLVAVAAALFATTSNAATYYFDYSVGTSTGGSYTDYDTGTSSTGDVTVTGFIETDGTLGIITQDDILSWGFTIAGEEDSRSISSTPTFAPLTYAVGQFNATADTLTPVTGVYFGFFEYGYSYEGEFIDFVPGATYDKYESAGVSGSVSKSGYDQAEVYTQERTCSSGGQCTPWVVSGDFGLTGHSETPQFVGTTMSVVPLPASLPLFLAGLGGLVLLRRRQKT